MIRNSSPVIVLVVCTLTALASPQIIEMSPFHIDAQLNDDSLIDMSQLLDAPAGKSGFITVRDGKLTEPHGKRFRVWGVNLTAAACFPEKEDAPAVAAHLARYGVNCVRFHFLDSNWSASVFIKGADNTRTLDKDQLDRFDYLIYQLKKRGIYSNINLNVGRNYRKGDGVADSDKIGLAKVINYFDDRIQFLHKEYAKQILTHYNPYTKSQYRTEPAVAIVELVNENSIIEAWFNDRLLGKHTGKSAGTWQDITPDYAEQLTRKYNNWLKTNLSSADLAKLRILCSVKPGGSISRLTKDQFEKAPDLRFHTEARFYMELESNYYLSMYSYLKNDLKTQALVAANSDHNHYRSGYALVSSTSKLDIVDGHVYWQHPKYTTNPKTKERSFWMKNSPMVADPFNSTVVQLARTAVKNKPFTVSETNHPFPNEYACEGIPILAAYAAFHDWDGLFFYTFAHSSPKQWNTKTTGHFDLRGDPVKMTNIASAANMFLRSDVASARTSIDRSYSAQQAREYIRAPWSQKPFFTPGFNINIPLMCTTRITSFDQPTPPLPMFKLGYPRVTDTEQLTWYHPPQDKGLVTVNTPKTQALIGFQNPKMKLGNLTAEIENPFASIVLTSLDNKPIADSTRLLLATTARSATTGMKFNEDRTSLTNWGRPPMTIESVKGKVILQEIKNARTITATPLDSGGRPLTEPSNANRQKNGYQITIGDKPTTWYLVRIDR